MELQGWVPGGITCRGSLPSWAGRGHILPGCIAAPVVVAAAAWLLLWLWSVFPIEPCTSSTALSWGLGRAQEMASHLNHSSLLFPGSHGQTVLLYNLLYSLCSLRLSSSWFMSVWCQTKLFSLDLWWNLILQTVTVYYCHYVNLVIFVFLTRVVLVCFMQLWS